MNPETIITLIYSDGSEREMTFGQFLSILNSRVVVQSEGRITCKVTQANLYTDEETGEQRYILNLNALSPDLYDRAVEHYNNEEWAEALNTQSTMNLRTTAAFIPVQGQLVQVDFALVRNREDTADVLRPVSVSPLPKAQVKRASFGTPNASTPNPEPDATSYTEEQIMAMSDTELKDLAAANNVDISEHLTGNGSKVKAGSRDAAKAVLVEELVA